MPQQIIVSKKNRVTVVECGPRGPQGLPGADGLRGEAGLPGVVINTDTGGESTIYQGTVDPRNMIPAPVLEVGDFWFDKVNRRWNGLSWDILSILPMEGRIDFFNYTGAPELFTVPANVYTIDFELVGGSTPFYWTSREGAAGGKTLATYPVTPGDVLQINVGGAGSPTSIGGWNGGGSSAQNCAGAGGTDVRLNGTTLNDRILVAGGAGGQGTAGNTGNAGFGGGLVGGGPDGLTTGGGTQIAAVGAGGLGYGANATGGGAGGGGGYYGGGEGGYGSGWAPTSGGGGSGYANPIATNVQHIQGGATTSGQVVLRYIATVP